MNYSIENVGAVHCGIMLGGHLIAKNARAMRPAMQTLIDRANEAAMLRDALRKLVNVAVPAGEDSTGAAMVKMRRAAIAEARALLGE